MFTTCKVIDLGWIEYGPASELQKQAVQEVMADKSTSRIYLLEHLPVYTIGRAGGEHNVLVDETQLKELGISKYEVDRGGDVTYHGPGQLVGYPILPLTRWGNDVRQYVRMLEEVVIRFLRGYGIEGGRIEGLSGVWVGPEKICAIGVKASRDRHGKSFITSHGFALNVQPNLSHFANIIPCGIVDKGVTSMKKLLDREIAMGEVKQGWVQAFEEVFEVKCEWDSSDV
ncbi:lipoyl(octanoyl) transferase LipB [Effusibacillus consociatus]|uniref:Octanoyltransferase n=1 Tax=Effusibacillus consociatus TaxID=1117041 RepID=A0ABV9Q5Z2_9BACL